MNQIWANPSSSESVRLSHYHPILYSESLQPDLDNQGFGEEFAVWFSFFANVFFIRGWSKEYWFLRCDYTSTKPALDNEVWGLGVCAWRFCLLDLKGCRGRNTVLRSAIIPLPSLLWTTRFGVWSGGRLIRSKDQPQLHNHHSPLPRLHICSSPPLPGMIMQVWSGLGEEVCSDLSCVF